MVVTHDRAFMESVCTSVLELEAGEVTLHNFGGPGSYDRFRQVRTQLTLRRECCRPYGLALNMPAMPNFHWFLVRRKLEEHIFDTLRVQQRML